LLAGAWSTWNLLLAETKRLRAIAAKVVAHWKSRLLAGAFVKWCHELVRRRKAKRAARMWKNRLMAMGWRGWNASLVEAKRLRAVAAKVVAYWKHRLLAGAWNRWLLRYQQLKKARTLVLRILNRWRNRAIGRCWEKWHQIHLIFVQAKKLAAGALRRWLNAALSRCFQKWSPSYPATAPFHRNTSACMHTVATFVHSQTWVGFAGATRSNAVGLLQRLLQTSCERLFAALGEPGSRACCGRVRTPFAGLATGLEDVRSVV